MWNKIKAFNVKYYIEIAWFFMGYFTLDLLVHLGKRDWIEVLIDIIFIGVNYWLYQEAKKEHDNV